VSGPVYRDRATLRQQMNLVKVEALYRAARKSDWGVSDVLGFDSLEIKWLLARSLFMAVAVRHSGLLLC
jgi:hypothetical protein